MKALQTGIRGARLEPGRYDVIVAAAVLHYLREEAEWEAVFRKFYEAMRPGGSLWIADLVHHSLPEVQQLMWRRYGEYLEGLRGPEYRDHGYAYVEFEDTPRPLGFQVDLLGGSGSARWKCSTRTTVSPPSK